MRVCVCESCLTLCDAMNCSPPGSSVHGISHARILEWVAFPFLIQGLNPGLLHCRWILYHLSHQGSPEACLLVKGRLLANILSEKTFPPWPSGTRLHVYTYLFSTVSPFWLHEGRAHDFHSAWHSVALAWVKVPPLHSRFQRAPDLSCYYHSSPSLLKRTHPLSSGHLLTGLPALYLARLPAVHNLQPQQTSRVPLCCLSTSSHWKLAWLSMT